ncbi:PTS transporter subunit EIIC [Erysipelothrix aquatica]|uniref:PTS transporter subunit EIIC n=1 Tax=Erysipelothrix aquatica TaxID=2683714 RepID=UPI00135C1F07|nr:PTS transporter subunit EIIC [Erysipelothrix aquatica]
MTIETIVNGIQQNKYLNAMKTAIIKVAFIQIGVALAIFMIHVFEQRAMISAEVFNQVPLYYAYYCILLGIIFAFVMAQALIPVEREYQIYTVTFFVMMYGVRFMESNRFLEFPIIALFLAWIMILASEKLSRIQFKSKHVPQAVNDYMTKLIPIVILLILNVLILVQFTAIVDLSASLLVYVTRFVASFGMVIATILLICGFWVLGIHGVAVIGTLLRPFWFYMMLVNGHQVITKQPILYIGSETFFQWIVWLGGSGCTLGLAIAIRFFAKSEQLKSFGKVGLNSSLFNINETILFGVPIVDNKNFRVPFFAAPIVCAVVGYGAMAWGYVSIPSIVSPWVLPAPLGIFISSLGDFRSVVLSLILIVISFGVYFPFFKRYDRELQAQEQQR